jgi:hypothetical protein
MLNNNTIAKAFVFKTRFYFQPFVCPQVYFLSILQIFLVKITEQKAGFEYQTMLVTKNVLFYLIFIY